MSIKNFLLLSLKEKKVVSIYMDSGDWDKYSVGYVDFVTDEYVKLRSLSRHGEVAGYEIRKLSDIFKVEVDGMYERKLAKLNMNQGKIYIDYPLDSNNDDQVIVDALKASQKDKIIVVVYGYDSSESLAGYVENFRDNTVSMRLIDPYGEDDGVTIININEIKGLDFNTQAEQIRRFLLLNKQSK